VVSAHEVVHPPPRSQDGSSAVDPTSRPMPPAGVAAPATASPADMLPVDRHDPMMIEESLPDEPSPRSETITAAQRAGPGRVTVEEVEDIDAGGFPKRPWTGEYPNEVATILGRAQTFFEELLEKQERMEKGLHAPFTDEEEWGLGSWLATSGLSQEEINKFLNLPI
ncbi:hypothetical protein BD414DRAFT_372959, partial [Trametes punicea]